MQLNAYFCYIAQKRQCGAIRFFSVDKQYTVGYTPKLHDLAPNQSFIENILFKTHSD